MNGLLTKTHANTSRLVTSGPGVVRIEWKNEQGEVIVMITMSSAEAEDAARELQASVVASKANSEQLGGGRDDGIGNMRGSDSFIGFRRVAARMVCEDVNAQAVPSLQIGGSDVVCGFDRRFEIRSDRWVLSLR